jgi:hypothetical protein
VATTDGVSVFTPTKIYATPQQMDATRANSEEGWLAADKTRLTHEIVVDREVPQGENAVDETHARVNIAIPGVSPLQ